MEAQDALAPARVAWAAADGLPRLTLAACALAADVATKATVRARMVEGGGAGARAVLHSRLRQNTGAAFSFFADAGGGSAGSSSRLRWSSSAVLAWMLGAKRDRVAAFA